MNRKGTKEDWTASLVEALDLQAAIADREGSLLFVSDALATSLNSTKSELFEKNIHSLFPSSAWKEAFKTEVAATFRLLTSHGVQGIRLTPYNTPFGSYCLILFFDPDNAELQHLRLGEAITDISHDLKNSLGVIKGFAALLAQDLPQEKRQLMVKNIIQASDELNDLITQLTHYAKPVIPEKKTFDLIPLIEDACTFSGADKNRILFEKPAKPVQFTGDPKLLRDALARLISNAFESLEEAGSVQISVKDEGNLIRIVIADEGSGVPERLKDKLFHIFSSSKGRGRGLGLVEAEKSIHAHGGTIEIRPGKTQGTLCTVHLARPHEN
ncbi:MAG: HAMP domain-containing histidine kinase [Chlamydiia bacterium]|nr:HAMP domain-containing histidine kinase [Chlamydiia bacterium]